ncbi:MAG: hypothetical protein WAQ28_15515 [Bacteroidia bacterium]
MNTKLSISKSFLVVFAALGLPVLSLSCLNAQVIASVKKDDLKGIDTSVNYIVKYKIKAINTLTYSTEDSTLNNAKLSSQAKTIYDRKGNLVENISENWAGKTMTKSVAKFDAKDNLIESTTYDSTGKVRTSVKYSYDDANRLTKSSSTSSLGMYTMKPEDDAKTVVYSDIRKYDASGNLIESITDSSGVVIYKTVSQFDNKNQLISSSNYDHNNLQSTITNVYDKKGGYIQTTEYYWSARKTQCSPNKNRTVSKFDSKGNLLSSVSTSDENGAISTQKTTNEYKFSGDKLLSIKTISEDNAEGFSSKSVSSQTYKYDKNGNEIESVMKYGGGGSSTYTTQTQYNSNNLMVKQTVYNGTCMDKPATISTYTYYPDGKTLKETSTETFDYLSKSVEKYDERELVTESIYKSDYSSTRVVYDYEYW